MLRWSMQLTGPEDEPAGSKLEPAPNGNWGRFEDHELAMNLLSERTVEFEGIISRATEQAYKWSRRSGV